MSKEDVAMLSFPEILVILLVAVMVLGPKRLPETARKLGHWIGLFKRASEEFKREIMTMDRVVDDTLNRAVSNVDQMVPDEILPAAVSADADLETLIGAPPPASPDDFWETEPVPGGLASEPTADTLDGVKRSSTSNVTSAVDSSAGGDKPSIAVPSGASKDVPSGERLAETASHPAGNAGERA
ncbi:MAG: twin-arginine translocase TatA/TatE family subunit [Kiritimatiellae bacterium]|nr:twin-arginine translocase TatA/TatE family subunit [Kiritimatiellia bacterium]